MVHVIIIKRGRTGMVTIAMPKNTEILISLDWGFLPLLQRAHRLGKNVWPRNFHGLQLPCGDVGLMDC